MTQPTVPAPATGPPIACTLGASEVPARLAEWEAVLAPVVSREPLDNGVRLVFPAGVSLAALVDLAAAEQACCGFFRFAVTLDSRGAALEVGAPPEAIDLVHSIFGQPA